MYRFVGNNVFLKIGIKHGNDERLKQTENHLGAFYPFQTFVCYNYTTRID